MLGRGKKRVACDPQIFRHVIADELEAWRYFLERMLDVGGAGRSLVEPRFQAPGLLPVRRHN